MDQLKLLRAEARSLRCHSALPTVSGRAGRYVFCGTFRRQCLSASPPACIPRPAFLRRPLRVTRHRALWCSDFPPPACAGSDPPPFQNQREYNLKSFEGQVARGEGRGAKSEGPKSEGNPKSEIRRPRSQSLRTSALQSILRPQALPSQAATTSDERPDVDFGFRISDFLRISAFGFSSGLRISPLDTRHSPLGQFNP